nr:hypothetical protein Iba_chr06bCG18120 [Ipomoea batatas]GME14550.1 hypothetical protein Iba_scaffold15261CG0590 [Ipomoea batatas]
MTFYYVANATPDIIHSPTVKKGEGPSEARGAERPEGSEFCDLLSVANFHRNS